MRSEAGSGPDAAPAAEAAPEPTGKFAEWARAKHELVHRLRAEGRGLREIARHLGWGLHTVQRYDRAATWQELETEDEQPRLKATLERCPELHAASGQVRAFAAMITDLTGQDLQQWTAAARDAGLPGIASFAKGLEHDLDAVTNGLTMNWGSGPVEGRVNHIKIVKRQMFGRAGLPLLRKRVLLTARR